eukprot:gene33177-22423_t
MSFALLRRMSAPALIGVEVKGADAVAPALFDLVDAKGISDNPMNPMNRLTPHEGDNSVNERRSDPGRRGQQVRAAPKCSSLASRICCPPPPPPRCPEEAYPSSWGDGDTWTARVTGGRCVI